MLGPKVPSRELEDGCFRIGYVLDRICVGPGRAKNRRRSKTDKVRGSEKEPLGRVQLHHGRLKEAFAPGAANGQALVKRLPAHPYLGYRGIGIVIQPLFVTNPGRELQRVEA